MIIPDAFSRKAVAKIVFLFGKKKVSSKILFAERDHQIFSEIISCGITD
jgi:hypothetical protein